MLHMLADLFARKSNSDFKRIYFIWFIYFFRSSFGEGLSKGKPYRMALYAALISIIPYLIIHSGRIADALVTLTHIRTYKSEPDGLIVLMSNWHNGFIPDANNRDSMPTSIMRLA